MVRIGVLAVALSALCGCAAAGDDAEPYRGAVPSSPAPSHSPAGEPPLGAPAGAAGAGDVEAEPGEAVTVQGFRFTPSALAAQPGAAVTWTNEDGVAHTVTAGTPAARGDAFHLRLDGRGDTATHAFTEPGRYRYFCAVHPSMRGEVVVG